MSAFAEIYERAAATPHSVDITTSVTADGGAIVWEHSDERSSSELQSANGDGHTVRVPMSGFQPGGYVLRVEARSRLGQTASRKYRSKSRCQRRSSVLGRDLSRALPF